MNELSQVENFNAKIYGTAEEPLFLARDIAEILEHSRASEMLKSVDDDEKLMQEMFASGQNRQMWFLTESGLYEVLMLSRKPKAKEFKRKVKEILKTIRKHGTYMTQPQVPTSQRELIMLALAGNEETNQRIDAIEEQVTDLKENATLNPGEYGYIGRRINQRVSEVAKGYGNITQEQRGKLYKDINQGVKAITGVSTRTQLRTKHYEVVLEFINDWEPSTATKMQVRQTSFEFLVTT